MFGPLEHGAYVGLLLLDDAFRNNRLKRSILPRDARWKPERDAKAVAGSLRCARFERACSVYRQCLFGCGWRHRTDIELDRKHSPG